MRVRQTHALPEDQRLSRPIDLVEEPCRPRAAGRADWREHLRLEPGPVQSHLLEVPAKAPAADVRRNGGRWLNGRVTHVDRV